MGVRVDKWLWSVRIFKSRSKATDACKSGHIAVNGNKVKASQMVNLGDHIQVKRRGFNFEYTILKLINKRVGAPIAQTCYADITPQEELLKFESWFAASRAKPEFREKGLGRPTKKERREIDRFKEE